MAERRRDHNDSSQMKDLLQPDDHPNCHKETRGRDSPGEAGGSSSASSAASCSRAVDVGGGRAERREPASTQRDEGTSSSCQLVHLKRLQHLKNQLGNLTCSRTHTVLVDVSLFKRGLGLVPHEGKHLWLSNCVKMPSSQVVNPNGPAHMSRWQVISKQLSALARRRSVSVEDVADAIVKYNPKYRGQWSFDALATFVKRVPDTENYFDTLFPKIAALALRLPEHVKKAVPLLQRGAPAAITLSQRQIACLLANAFFCTFPHRNTSDRHAEYHNYPSINFSSLFGSWSDRKKEKLRAVMHYFKVVTDEHAKLEGLVTFERLCLRVSPDWRSCKRTLCKLHVTSLGNIENEGTGMLQVDFASSWIGGGVLGSGLVQEEILFLIDPELIVSRLFTERLDDHECLIVTGAQQFSCYSGFSDSFEWAGPHEDKLDRDEWARLKRKILAIDALNFKHREEQYSMTRITRELNKAFCGFRGIPGVEEPDIATGKWGCGAFNGDPQLKALIQLMAAAKAGRGLAFFTFGDEHLQQSLQQVHRLLVTAGVTVGQLYTLLEQYCGERHKPGAAPVDLFEFIRRAVRRCSQL